MITNSKSGPGSSGMDFSMFGARRPLRAPEDENGSGGAAPALAPAPPVDPVSPAPAAVAPEKTLTQTQVNALVAAEKRDTEAKTRAKVLQEIADKAAPPPKPAPKGDGSMSAEDVQTLLSRDRAFTRATATAGLNDRQLTRMEQALKADAPADVGAWSAAYIEDLGLAKAPPPPATAASPGTPAPVVIPPGAPNAPAKVESITAQGLPNPWALTAAQIDELGPSGCRAMLEQLTTVGRARLGTPPVPKLPARK